MEIVHGIEAPHSSIQDSHLASNAATLTKNQVLPQNIVRWMLAQHKNNNIKTARINNDLIDRFHTLCSWVDLQHTQIKGKN
ncbi:MAG: hypothetical protein VX541_09215 [Candidatus Poribacteria bacterium]|nr:hypothetical protein [Candidatus Poribacteria bacterium]